jgi:hypothetical protein
MWQVWFEDRPDGRVAGDWLNVWPPGRRARRSTAPVHQEQQNDTKEGVGHVHPPPPKNNTTSAARAPTERRRRCGRRRGGGRRGGGRGAAAGLSPRAARGDVPGAPAAQGRRGAAHAAGPAAKGESRRQTARAAGPAAKGALATGQVAARASLEWEPISVANAAPGSAAWRARIASVGLVTSPCWRRAWLHPRAQRARQRPTPWATSSGRSRWCWACCPCPSAGEAWRTSSRRCTCCRWGPVCLPGSKPKGPPSCQCRTPSVRVLVVTLVFLGPSDALLGAPSASIPPPLSPQPSSLAP